MKFEDLKKVNETIVTMDVKGKPYALVNERIKAFRMLYPEGTIETEMLSNENGVCVFKASIYIPEYDEVAKNQGVVLVNHTRLLGTGTAYEKENSTFINKTSYIENCETSAVGRALAMCGIGIDTSIASAEEVQNAIANQDDKNDKLQLMARLKELVIETETNYDELLKYYEVNSDSDMSVTQLKDAIKKLERKLK